MRPGPSKQYTRLLRGELTPERYVAIIKRHAHWRLFGTLTVDAKDRRMAKRLKRYLRGKAKS
jgi:hypothetical protein